MKIIKNPETARKINGYKLVNERIKNLREARDKNATRNTTPFKQVEMADIFDLPAQNWNKLESGKYNKGNNPTVEHLIQMSVFWGVPIDYIVTGEYPSVLKMSGTDNGLNKDLLKEIDLFKERLMAKDELIATQRTVIEALKENIELMKTHKM